jgi:ubiquinone biosynthesis UbiH/UbiF/VisC/COQ6 family hydroxylase
LHARFSPGLFVSISSFVKQQCGITTDATHLYNPSMKFEVVIIGGGIVGASLALALKDSGLKIALVESLLPSPLPDDKSWDSRIYAISPGSASFLENLNVWPTIDRDRVTPVYEMTVFGDDSSARLDFSAYDVGMTELAFIVENRQLQAATWSALKRQKTKVKVFCPMQCTSIEWNESHANVRLTNDKVLQAALIVGADGLNSWVRKQAEIEISQHSYQQSGVVANFSSMQSHQNVARQWFRRDGVLALLPLPNKLVSMVWSANEEQANALLNLPKADICQQVDEASNHVLGKLQLITRPAAFPLNFVHVKNLIKPRLALIGDAAHGIHPLAGQGVNLGLRDACELATTIIERGSRSDCGDYMLLRRYERARKEDILSMELTTDSLQKLFNNENPTLARLRNLGLGITNQLPLIKNYLMQHALS